jgi:hypothetical protein
MPFFKKKVILTNPEPEFPIIFTASEISFCAKRFGITPKIVTDVQSSIGNNAHLSEALELAKSLGRTKISLLDLLVTTFKHANEAVTAPILKHLNLSYKDIADAHDWYYIKLVDELTLEQKKVITQIRFYILNKVPTEIALISKVGAGKSFLLQAIKKEIPNYIKIHEHTPATWIKFNYKYQLASRNFKIVLLNDVANPDQLVRILQKKCLKLESAHKLPPITQNKINTVVNRVITNQTSKDSHILRSLALISKMKA